MAKCETPPTSWRPTGDPLVAGLSVARGAPGTGVTITGGGLAKATAVSFGGAGASFPKTVANGVTKLVATAPAHVAGPVDIAVTDPAGTSADTGADDVTYPAPPPVLSSLSPTTGTATGGTTVTPTGTAFTGATGVTAGGTALSYSVASATSIRVILPAHAAGSVSVQVTTAGGTTSHSPRWPRRSRRSAHSARRQAWLPPRPRWP